MNYGFTIGTAGVVAAMHRQDVAANNLANIQTVGFKPDSAFTIPRAAARQEDGLYDIPSNALLERLGAGVLFAPTRTSYTQGTISRTRNPFDLAVQGEGFLSVSVNTTSEGDNIRLTRDGRLTLDQAGRLITATGGHRVLDNSGRPITLNRSQDFNVQTDGTISQAGVRVAKLGFFDVPDRSVLRKTGDNLFSLSPSAASSKVPAKGEILQYSTEDSAADPIRAMLAVQSASNAVGTMSKVMQIHDDLMNRAINTLGRVST